MPNREVTGWAGWGNFAGLLMVITGVFQAVAGLTALLKDSFYVAAGESLVVFDFETWGWLHLILGGLLLAAGTAVMGAQTWGRTFGALLAMLGIVASFVFVAAYPVWAVIMMVAYVAILYSLVVRAD